MYMNKISQTCYIMETVSKQNGKHYLVHFLEYTPNAGIFSGCTIYEIFVTDSDPEHDCLVGVFHKAFLPYEIDEEERAAELQLLFDQNIESAIDKFERILSDIL